MSECEICGTKLKGRKRICSYCRRNPNDTTPIYTNDGKIYGDSVLDEIMRI